MALSKKRALEITNDLRSALILTQDKIELAIVEQVWEPLGFDSFTQWWAHYFGDIQINAAILPHILYAMFEDGATIEEVANTVRGISEARAERIKQQQEAGVPAADASTHLVRPHIARNPSPPSFLHLEIGDGRMKLYKRLAAKVGMTVEEVALDAIQQKFDSL